MQAINYSQAKFLLSTPTIKNTPTDEGSEIIFVGRSNVGKSSCINALTRKKKLAKISKKPGKTQHLVFFDLGNNNKLVDAPGYGFAKVSKKIKQEWGTNLYEYFSLRRCLKGAVLLMDIRHPLQKSDDLMLKWCLNSNIMLHILLTKADKVSKSVANATLFKLKKQAGYNTTIQLFSTIQNRGIDELVCKLDYMFNESNSANNN